MCVCAQYAHMTVFCLNTAFDPVETCLLCRIDVSAAAIWFIILGDRIGSCLSLEPSGLRTMLGADIFASHCSACYLVGTSLVSLPECFCCACLPLLALNRPVCVLTALTAFCSACFPPMIATRDPALHAGEHTIWRMHLFFYAPFVFDDYHRICTPMSSRAQVVCPLLHINMKPASSSLP